MKQLIPKRITECGSIKKKKKKIQFLLNSTNNHEKNSILKFIAIKGF